MRCICVVTGCSNNSDEARRKGLPLRFFKFPEDLRLRTTWLRKCGRPPKYFKVSNYTRVCNIHFTHEDFEDGIRAKIMTVAPKRLKSGSIPSQHLEHKRRSVRELRREAKKKKELVESILAAADAKPVEPATPAIRLSKEVTPLIHPSKEVTPLKHPSKEVTLKEPEPFIVDVSQFLCVQLDSSPGKSRIKTEGISLTDQEILQKRCEALEEENAHLEEKVRCLLELIAEKDSLIHSLRTKPPQLNDVIHFVDPLPKKRKRK